MNQSLPSDKANDAGNEKKYLIYNTSTTLINPSVLVEIDVADRKTVKKSL